VTYDLSEEQQEYVNSAKKFIFNYVSKEVNCDDVQVMITDEEDKEINGEYIGKHKKHQILVSAKIATQSDKFISTVVHELVHYVDYRQLEDECPEEAIVFFDFRSEMRAKYFQKLYENDKMSLADLSAGVYMYIQMEVNSKPISKEQVMWYELSRYMGVIKYELEQADEDEMCEELQKCKNYFTEQYSICKELNNLFEENEFKPYWNQKIKEYK